MVCAKVDGLGDRGRRSAHGRAASSCAASASSVALAGRPAEELDAERQAVVVLRERQR